MHIPFHSIGYPLPIQQAEVCKLKPSDFENSGYFGWKPWQLFKADKREDFKGIWRISPPQREDQGLEFK